MVKRRNKAQELEQNISKSLKRILLNIFTRKNTCCFNNCGNSFMINLGSLLADFAKCFSKSGLRFGKTWPKIRSFCIKFYKNF